jgi:predicted DNA-binding transcriptional regulator AlpA
MPLPSGGTRHDHGDLPMPPTDQLSRYLRTPEAARYLGLSGRTLEKHRTYGTGPTYHKLGGRVVYAIDDLKIWADRGTRSSTSDPGTDIIYPAKRRDDPPRTPARPTTAGNASRTPRNR